MNIPKTHLNADVASFLQSFFNSWELCEHHPQIEDLLTGALELKTAGNTSARSLSRKTLFHILQSCPRIDVASIKEATHGRYSYSTLASYAATARVASEALGCLIASLPAAPGRQTIKEAQQAIDAPYQEELRALGFQ